MLEGLIIGDGHLRRGVQSALSVTGKHIEWIDHIAARLTAAGIDVRRSAHAANYYAATVSTPAYAAFRALRDRWYPDGKKNIPGDFMPDPETTLYWYLGDGGLKRNTEGSAYSVELSTYAFPPSAVVMAAKRLMNFAGLRTIRVYQDYRGPWISVAMRDVQKFLTYIGPCPVACYTYKWDVPTTTARTRNLVEWTAPELVAADRLWRTRRKITDDPVAAVAEALDRTRVALDSMET